MGCDIHMFIEWREESEDKWQLDRHHVEIVDDCGNGETHTYLKEVSATGRWYWLFGILAEVRVETPFRWKQRGLPEDVSDKLSKHIADDPDLHSHSWLTPKEFKESLRKLHADCMRDYRCHLKNAEDTSDPEVIDPPHNMLDDLGEAVSCFYDWNETPRAERPRDWVSILDYISREQDQHNAEQILLKPNNPTKLEARLVFCFDN